MKISTVLSVNQVCILVLVIVLIIYLGIACNKQKTSGSVQTSENQTAQTELDSIAQFYVNNAIFAKNTVYVQFERGLTLYTTDLATANRTIQIIDRIMNKIHIKITRNIHDPFYIYNGVMRGGNALTIYGLIVRTD